MTRGWPWLAVWAAALCALPACSPSTPQPNVLVIVIDALRADRVDFYDTHPELTPVLQSLADHGTVFWNAYAPSSWTSPSMASLWTARYPATHGVNTFNAVLSDAMPALPSILKAHGYTTGGFTGNVALGHALGFGQGFDNYDVLTGPKPHGMFGKARAEQINQHALSWLDTVRAKSKAPVFLYLHYVDTHFPYTPPKEFFDRILARCPDPQRDRQIVYDLFYIHPQRWHQTDPETVAVLRDLYDAEVIHTDAAIGQLLAELKARGFFDNAIAVITSEHGEAFLEHGTTSHRHTLYNELIHVPLLLLLPGQSSRSDLRQPVSLIDLAPTALGLLNISAPSAFEGRSLAPALQSLRSGPASAPGHSTPGSADSISPVYSELLQPQGQEAAPDAHLRALVLGAHKLIMLQNGTTESYDLSADPGETRADGLSATDRVTLEAQLARRTREQRPVVVQHAELDAVAKGRLHALGYIE